MNPAIIEKAIELFKSVSDLSQKVVDAGDSEKYAKSVEELNKGVSNSYDAMREIIISSDKFSEEEKLERLSKLAEQEQESKRKCGEAIKGNRENVANIALEVIKGFLTCGISFVPAIAKNMKIALKDEQQVIESQEPLLLEEKTQKNRKRSISLFSRNKSK